MPNKSSFQRSRLSLLFGIFTAILAAGTVVAATVWLLVDRPFVAVLTMGIGVCLMGAMRGIWPGHPWFGSRNRVADVVVYLLVGAAILGFASGVSVAI